MRRNLTDLLVVSGLALAALATTLLGVEHAAPRLLLGLPLAIILPGYALAAALFPRPSLPDADRALYTLGLSLCASILGGFALNASPWGLAPASWAVLLAYITLGGCVVAFARRQLPPSEPAALQPAGANPSRPAYGLSLGQGLLFGLALLVVAGAVGLARAEAGQRPAADVLQLWMLPDTDGDGPAVRVGLTSVGPAVGTYRLQLMRGGYRIHEWPAITLGPGERWEATLSLAGRQPGAGAFEARLSRVDDPHTTIRQVSRWLESQ
jgi:hypothetical protein